jgi:site-specific DNA recombinase
VTAHERLDRVGVAIRSGTEPFDTASPIGRFVFSLFGSMAELERDTIAERMTRGRDRVAKQGRYTGGIVPTGYDLDEAGCLVASERIVPKLGITEAELVRDVFSRIANGETTLTSEAARSLRLASRASTGGAARRRGPPSIVSGRAGR